MELSYPNYCLEYHEEDGNITRPEDGLEITDHASIPTVSTPEKMPPRYHSDSFDYKEPMIDTKADIEGKEPVVDGKQDILRGSPKCYNGSVQLFN